MKQLKTSQVLTGVLFVAVTAPGVAVGQAPFLGYDDPILILTGKVPYHVKAMDLDGINGIDLVVANKGNPADPAGSPPSIETFLSDGMGGFTLDQVFDSFFVTQPRQLATGFVNSDNVLDLVVADGAGNRIVVFLGRPAASGGGFFPNPQPFLVTLPVASVDLGLINGDNFLDAVTGNFNVTHQLGSLFGDGTGNFGQTTLFDYGAGASPDPTVFVSLGMPNMVVSLENPLLAGEGTPGGGMTLSTIDSGGNFSNPAVFFADIGVMGTSPNRPTAVRIEDVNNNGVPDLVVAANGMASSANDWGNGIFFAFEGVFEFPAGPSGNPVFKSTKFITTPSPRPFDIAIADVNGDIELGRTGNVIHANKDIVITHWNAATGQSNDFVGNADLTVLIDDGSGMNEYDNDVDDVIDGVPFEFIFSVLGLSTTQDVFVSPRFVELADIDGDGLLDIITTRTRNDERSDDQPNGHIAIFKNLGNLPLPGTFGLSDPVNSATPILAFQTSNPPSIPCFTLEDNLFTWEPAFSEPGFEVTYTLEISVFDGFPEPVVLVFEESGIGGEEFTVTSAHLQESLDANMTTHFWRVTATNAAGDTLSTSDFSFTIQNRADLGGDGLVNAADMAVLLGAWGEVLVDPDTSCIDIAPLPSEMNPSGGDGMIDGGDLAFLLGNWHDPGGTGSAMAQPGGIALGDTTLFQDDSGATQPSQNITTTSSVPWVIAHFGFDSVASYTGWLDLLTEDELFSHIADMIDLII